MTLRFSRLLHLGNVVIDVVLDVPALPDRGGDVRATGSRMAPGGGFNVMAAAARQGMRVAYGGAHGSGPLAAMARAALADERIEVLLPPKAGIDTGFVVVMVDASGERTFVTSRGAEATMTSADLAGIEAATGDAVYLSGYGLAYPGNRAALLDWLGRLGAAPTVFVDPGPLVRLIPADVVDRVLARVDWWTCNAREAAALAGCADPADAASALAARARAQRKAVQPKAVQPKAVQPKAVQRAAAQPARSLGVLVRTGPSGCLLCHPGTAPVRVPGFDVAVVDTNGAGDAHVGAFIAALASGADETVAARTANAAAALAVTRRGPATAPDRDELSAFLAQHRVRPA